MSTENNTPPISANNAAPCIHLHPNLLSIWDIADGCGIEPSCLIQAVHDLIEGGQIARDNVAIAPIPTHLGISCPVYYLNFAAAMHVASRVSNRDNSVLQLLRYLEDECIHPEMLADVAHPYALTQPWVEVDQDSQYYTPSEMGAPHGLSSRQVNLRLVEYGFQERVAVPSSDTDDLQVEDSLPIEEDVDIELTSSGAPESKHLLVKVEDEVTATEEVNAESAPPLVGLWDGKLGKVLFGGGKFLPTEENVE